MGKYEYIGKREIMRRVSNLGYLEISGKRAATQSLRAWNGWSLQKPK